MIASFEYRSESIATSPLGRHTVEYPLLIHPQIEYIFISSGTAICTVDGFERTLHEGEMAIVFSYIPHKYRFIDAEYYMVMFDPNLCPDFNKDIKVSKPEYPFLNSYKSKQLSEILLKAHSSHRSHDKLGEKIAKGYINVLVGETLQIVDFISSCNEDSDVLTRILIYCSENYKKDIHIDTLAKNIGISQKYCSNIISSRLGENFREYINTLRMFEATKLLKRTDHNITYIALEVGYKNQSTFNRVFLKRYGISPSEYRKTKESREKFNKIYSQ